MAIIFSSSNMIMEIRNHYSPSPSSVKAFAFSKGIFVNPINLKIDSNSKHKPCSFAIKACQAESDRDFVAKELEAKRIMVTPTKPELDNFKEPELEKQSLKFVEAKKSSASSSKEKIVTQTSSMDYQQVLKYPLVTEAAMHKIIEENTLVFMVDVRANKKDIRNAFENMLKIKTKKINTLINYDGTKKAYIQLTSDNQAVTVAKKMKILA
ncbi:60S ribosomal protein L23a-2-like [Cynara cardunculus var. scolymus]|nr:60S ribosomal protein L23a-2-like [Cynara cardunculus var. scolymus]